MEATRTSAIRCDARRRSRRRASSSSTPGRAGAFGPHGRLLPDDRRVHGGLPALRADLQDAGAAGGLRARRACRRRSLREDGAQRHRVRDAASLCGRLRDPACLEGLQAQSVQHRQPVEPRERGALLAQRAGRTGLRKGRRSHDDQGVRRRFGRGQRQGASRDGPRRRGARGNAVPVDAFAVAAGGVVRRQGDRGAPQRVRRSRGEVGMSPRLSVAARIADALRPAAFASKTAEPCTLVIFGAGGDLTRRKLLPALYHLRQDGLLPPSFAVIGVARERLDDTSFRAAMRHALDEFAGDGGKPDVAHSLCERLFYVPGDLDDAQTYAALRTRLEAVDGDDSRPAGRGRLLYLAIPPSVYPEVIRHLHGSGVAPQERDPGAPSWVRVIIEKPFGHSLESARALNAVVRQAFAEHQVYRIDHYLGKETVQNLLVFRFSNSIFEPLWNGHYIDHVQITNAETVGVERRGGYFDNVGTMRDMVPNHIMQLISLTAMEPPASFKPEAVRDEQAKV